MKQISSIPVLGVADLLRRAEELEKRHAELMRQAEQALDLPPKTLRVFLEDGYEYNAKNSKRYRIWYRPLPSRSMRTKGGKTQFYDAFDHFFSVAEGDAIPPDEVVVVPIVASVFRSYESKTGRSLREDEEIRIGLCLERIEEALDRGLDLFGASLVEPRESPLLVTPAHLERYLSRRGG
jgi:hypothetical protein